jgi:glycosyltransferase involved in cell wall biosynthesis
MSSLYITIPVYEMAGRGVEMLSYSLDRLKEQDYTDFTVVVSDDSRDDKIRDLCDSESKNLDILYLKNDPDKKGSSSNLNNAIRNCPLNSYIKILCQDDYMWGEDALTLTLKALEGKKWLVTSYLHTQNRQQFYKKQIPSISQYPYLDNLIGTHSAISFYNDGQSFFDENLKWYMDCDFSYRLLLKFGLPVILQEVTMIQTIWSGQISTSQITNNLVQMEYYYLINKYGGKPYII